MAFALPTNGIDIANVDRWDQRIAAIRFSRLEELPCCLLKTMTEHTALESEPRNPIEGHLEGLARSMAEAINSRDFSIRSRIWSHVASDFVAETGFSEWPRRTTSLTEFLSRFVSHTASHPEYSMHLNEVSTKLNEKTGRAYVWVSLEAMGLPPGTSRPNVGTLDFVFCGHRWICVKWQCFPGHFVDVGL